MDNNNDEFLKEIDELLSVSDKLEEPVDTCDGSDEQRPSNGVDALRAALAAHDDIEVIRGLCEGQKVPDELRKDLWKECLNVWRRPDALGGWTGPLDCEDQEVLHSQCVEQAAKLEGLSQSEREQAVSDMELVLIYYCKTRNMRYTPDCGWPELLLPFLSLGMTNADLFNCFYAMTVKYIPRDCRADGRPFHLFRLLLLYHDPLLCSLLDTKKLAPEAYLQPWLRSLFVCQCGLEVGRVMWDHYLLERDPFLIFFLALVMIVNSKELVQASTDAPDVLAGSLIRLPAELSVEDIEDFFSLAKYYASRTPQSFKKDFHSLLYGSGRSLASISTNISHVLCLPVSVQEILDCKLRQGAGMKFFVVDCRPVEQFSCGRFPNCFHLDANLLLHSPEDFSVAVERLYKRVRRTGVEGGEHLCFLGSGREQEDQYVVMVVAKFLQKAVPYVSLARGGFLELIGLLGSRASSVLEDYEPTKCQQFYSETSSYTAAHQQNDHSDSDSDASMYRQKLHAKGAKLYESLASGFKDKSLKFKTRLNQFWNSEQKHSSPVTTPTRHVSNSDRPSRRYRNVHADIFVIADDEEENEHGSSGEEMDQMINISLFTTTGDVLHSFPCMELRDGTSEYPSHLLLTKDSMVILRELSDRAGWARVKHRCRLGSILKITAKKKHPDIITFKFGSGFGAEAVVTHYWRFRIPNTQKVTAAIKTQIGVGEDKS